MFIIPLFPVLCADWLLADDTPQSWCSACLFSFVCYQFSCKLFSVTHLIKSPWWLSKIDTLISTLVCPHLRSTIIGLLWPMGDPVCMTLQTKEAFLAVTRLESTWLHIARSLARYSIPVKTDAIVEKRYPKINLEIVATLIFVSVFLPLWLFNTLLSKKCHETVLNMNNLIQRPSKNPKVPPVSVDTCWVITAILVILINTIHWSDISCMGLWL